MKKKYVIAIVIIIFLGGYFAWQYLPTENGLSRNEEARLIKSLDDPFVQHIRTVIDNYNRGGENSFPDLDFGSYQEYLQSRFVMLATDNQSLGGGKTMSIVFTDKPDKLFSVWVYKQGDGSYDLRAFDPNEEISSEEALTYYKSLKPLIDELGLAI